MNRPNIIQVQTERDISDVIAGYQTRIREPGLFRRNKRVVVAERDTGTSGWSKAALLLLAPVVCAAGCATAGGIFPDTEGTPNSDKVSIKGVATENSDAVHFKARALRRVPDISDRSLMYGQLTALQGSFDDVDTTQYGIELGAGLTNDPNRDGFVALVPYAALRDLRADGSFLKKKTAAYGGLLGFTKHQILSDLDTAINYRIEWGSTTSMDFDHGLDGEQDTYKFEVSVLQDLWAHLDKNKRRKRKLSLQLFGSGESTDRSVDGDITFDEDREVIRAGAGLLYFDAENKWYGNLSGLWTGTDIDRNGLSTDSHDHIDRLQAQLELGCEVFRMTDSPVYLSVAGLWRYDKHSNGDAGATVGLTWYPVSHKRKDNTTQK